MLDIKMNSPTVTTLPVQSNSVFSKQLDNLHKTVNRVKTDWSFHKIKNLRQLLHSVGLTDKQIAEHSYYEHELNAKIDKTFIWNYLDDLRIELDVKQFLYHNPPAQDLEYDKNSNKNSKEANTSSRAISCEISGDNIGEKESLGIHLPISIKEKAFLFWFQKKAASELLTGILSGKQGQLLLAGVGTGKTFILGAVLRRLLDANWAENKTPSPFPIIYVTKASIVEQTQRVLLKHFSITDQEVVVINIEQLRAKFGSMFLKEKIEFENGSEKVIWQWRKNVNPCLIVWDECQVLKNNDSTQSKIAQSFNEIDDPNIFQIFSSATPFTRVAEAKCFSVSTRVPYTFGIAVDAPLTNRHWNDFSEEVAHPSDPREHSPSAVNRLIDKLEPYIVRVKNVKSQFKAQNSVKMIDFETVEDKLFYTKAWENYLIQKAKIEGEDGEASNSKFQILVQFLKFRQAAELCRAEYLAREMFLAVKSGKAAVAALNFKNTITKITCILIEKYGVSRDEISLIWGGAAAPKTKKQKKIEEQIKAKKELQNKLNLNPDVLAAMEAEGLTLADFGIDDIDIDELEEQPEFTKDIPDEYKLGAQSLKERQKEIDKFQSGKSLYCLYTFRAGGVGLSLHHTDEFVKPKVRHKESGYAFIEDIPLIPTRPRINFVAPTYSAIELVQGLGRAPRLTSLSDTIQYLCFFKGTIEEKVAYIVSIKLRCLSKVVRQKESWEGVALKTHVDDPEQEYTKEADNVPDEDTGYVTATIEEGDEE